MKTWIRRTAVAALAGLSLLSVVQTAPADAAPKGDGKFHTVGSRVIGPDGNDYTIRGVSKTGFEYNPYGYDNDLWNYTKIRNWGGNTWRLAVASNFGVKGMCSYDKNYMGRIDRAANFARQLHMLMIIDNHFATKGQTCGIGGWSTNQKMPDVQSLNFVKALGKRYKNNPYVAIELYNEPHGITWDIWHDGGIVDGYKAVGMQQMLDGVRSTGFSGLVIIGGVSWSMDLTQIVNNPLKNDGNAIYGAHAYPYQCDGRTIYKEEPYRCRGGAQRPNTLDDWVQPLVGRKPMILSEFGTQRAIDGEIREPIQWAEDRHMGWIAWQWAQGKPENYALMNPDGSPSVQGKPVLDFMLKANGWSAPKK